MTSIEQQQQQTDIVKQKVEKNAWAIRPCFLYKDEYKECKSMKGRFHQYFIHGESIDCESWIQDFDRCVKYEDTQDMNAAVNIIDSEEKRRYDRLRAHYDNDVWIKRKGPPDDWNKPLPEWLEKKIENSYLSLKAKEMNEQSIASAAGGVGKDLMQNRTMCVIM